MTDAGIAKDDPVGGGLFFGGEREGAGGGDSARSCSGFERFTPGAVSHRDSPRTGRTGRGWEDHDKAMVV